VQSAGFSDVGCYVADQHAGRGAALWRLPHHRDGGDHARGAARRARPSFGSQRADGAAVVLKYDEEMRTVFLRNFFQNPSKMALRVGPFALQ
jgi:hypothetical protein